MSILGVWMWPQNVSLYGAAHVVSHCARAGVTDIYFLTKGLAGTAAYKSAYAPPGSENDLLRELLDAAHRHGIRVHAWFTSASDAHYKRLHPESGRCHFTRGKDNDLIAITDEGYLAYMETIVSELCTGYEIDGLHLDYIRYNHMLYGWDESDMARYAKEGADIPHLRSLITRTFLSDPKEESCIFDALRAGDASATAFARVRRQDVYRFAKRITSLARAKNSSLILSAALMPEGAYPDTAFADLHYGQSYQDAAALYDYALPMAYSKAYEKDSAWVRHVAEGTMKTGAKTIVGLHAYEGGTGASLQADIAALGASGAEGVCLFREGAFVFAYQNGSKLCVYNALTQPVTRIEAKCGEETLRVETTIEPGAETCISLPAAPLTVRAYTPQAETCVYLTREHSPL